MSASTDQKVRELTREVMSWGRSMLDRTHEQHLDEATKLIQSAITQAIAVETAVLRDALQLFANAATKTVMNGPHVGKARVEAFLTLEQVASIQAILSAQPSPGAKAEDTASAEFLEKALDDAIRIGGLSVSPAYPNKIVTRRGWRTQKDYPELAEQILIRTKEQP